MLTNVSFSKKIKAVETLSKSESNLLSFYDNPVSSADEDCYVHSGVTQAIRQQSLTSKYRITKGKDISYNLQDSTKNSILGISPVA